MIAIYKFRIEPGLTPIPKRMIPISVGVQGGHVMVWGTVDTAHERGRTDIVTYMTGQEIDDTPPAVPAEHHPPPLEFLGTVTVAQGNIVVHVFFRRYDRDTGDCRCAEIQRQDPRRHFRGCPERKEIEEPIADEVPDFDFMGGKGS